MSRVLMVDDAGLFQMLEASFLRRTGCDIVRTADESELVRRAPALRPDLILLDSERPGCDTPASVRALKADPALRAVPVVVVTSSRRLADCAAAGADATLVRPLQRGALDLALASIEGPAQRSGRRRPARLPVRLASTGSAWRGRVKDISRSGLFVALPHPPPLAAAVEVSLRLPGDAGATLQAHGVVVRQVAPDPDSHLLPGVGVRFTDLDALTESRIASFVGGDDADDEGIGDDAG